MSQDSERVILARRHVARGRQIVEGQKLMVRDGRANTAEALKLLALFEATQNIFEDDLERILREDARLETWQFRLAISDLGGQASTLRLEMVALRDLGSRPS
ncbi:hypothetical protein [Bradyrhizobium sp. CIR3A]|uniref:hypothetical protein n=1 Tax=Bradyrhizobium sp. CIR3A TaxID=2663838 RepID=UPI001605E387|nr:hypothetical protein [Bradyrhizobium sp. CIR3A]MBB4264323.1 hypothetical protein [Bradyrhizobium sp. CIR3A]